MKITIKFLQFHMPQAVKKLQLQLFLKMSAEAFGCNRPDIKGKPYEEALRIFAVFTTVQTEKTLRDKENAGLVYQELRNQAFHMGLRLSKMMCLSKQEDIVALIQLLYRNIGIELEENSPGNILIRRCYFSDFYSASVCGFISAMDDGIFAGLNGGGKLEFQKRITEGNSCCQAYFDKGR